MRTEMFMYFCIKEYIGTQGKVCRQLKYLYYPPPPSPMVVYATDRSKAVVPVLFLFCVALWFILRLRLWHFLDFSINFFMSTQAGQSSLGLFAIL